MFARTGQTRVVSWRDTTSVSHLEQIRPVRKSSLAAAYQAQLRALYALAGLLALGTFVVMRNPLFLIAALAVSYGASRVGSWLRPKPLAIHEPLAVWGIGTFAVFFVSTLVQFPMTTGSTALVGLSSFIIVGAWALHRLPADSLAPQRPVLESMRASVTLGLLMAAAYAIVATLLFGVARAGHLDDAVFSDRSLVLVISSYVLAAACGGCVVGIARPLIRWPLGRMCVGIPVAALVYGFAGLAMLLIGDPEAPTTLREAVVTGASIGGLVGPVGAIVFADVLR
jgi:hypothetical protein